MNISAVRNAANCTPAIARPMPPSTAWTMAVTPTPRATPRIALPARTIASSPRSPPSLRPKCFTLLAAVSPCAYISAATMTVSRNCSVSAPTTPACANSHAPTSRAYGATFSCSPMTPDASTSFHISAAFGPT